VQAIVPALYGNPVVRDDPFEYLEAALEGYEEGTDSKYGRGEQGHVLFVGVALSYIGFHEVFDEP